MEAGQGTGYDEWMDQQQKSECESRRDDDHRKLLRMRIERRSGILIVVGG